MSYLKALFFGGSCLDPTDPNSLIFHIPSRYGYVVLAATGSIIMVQWKAYMVAKARRDFGIPNYILFSPDNKEFNYIQRAYQETQHLHPQYLALLMIGGLEMPVFSSIAGTLWLTYESLSDYFCTFIPEERMRKVEVIPTLVHWMLLGATLKFGYHLISSRY